MKERELEEVMRQFVAGEIDVLVSTLIVESGIDVPNANTMFVDAQAKLKMVHFEEDIAAKVQELERLAFVRAEDVGEAKQHLFVWADSLTQILDKPQLPRRMAFVMYGEKLLVETSEPRHQVIFAMAAFVTSAATRRAGAGLMSLPMHDSARSAPRPHTIGGNTAVLF